MERCDGGGCWYPPQRLGQQLKKTAIYSKFLKLALLLLYTSTNVLLQFWTVQTVERGGAVGYLVFG
jgi:hypothetical protein